MFFLKLCFGPLGKFQHNIKISIKTARVSRLSVSYDYDATEFYWTEPNLDIIILNYHFKSSHNNTMLVKPKFRIDTKQANCFTGKFVTKSLNPYFKSITRWNSGLLLTGRSVEYCLSMFLWLISLKDSV